MDANESQESTDTEASDKIVQEEQSNSTDEQIQNDEENKSDEEPSDKDPEKESVPKIQLDNAEETYTSK